jgi:deoxyribodipyrimidine photo-lyase
VVTDDFPSFFLPRMVAAAGQRFPVRLEAVDSNGLLPLRATDRAFVTAFSFRRFLQKSLRNHLDCFPQRDPIARVSLPRLASLSQEVVTRWPPASREFLDRGSQALKKVPIDQTVCDCGISGGSRAAEKALKGFLQRRLGKYCLEGNHPDADATSGLSPYLHFGHISSHEIFARVAKHEGWTEGDLALKATGSRTGWWGMGEDAEHFLDQLITWRELGFNMCSLRGDYDQFESLPAWAQETLLTHERDRRQYVYTLDEFEAASTHDPLWNAAQRQLLQEGRIHNYLRMLWGKKILEWSSTPREALAVMIALNDKYALDGRDPNSYSGIFWVLGRYDRPWGPEREIFGKVRYMSSRNTLRKVHVTEYLKKFED